MPDETLADVLNRSCHCINVDPQVLQQSLESRFGERGVYARLRESHPHLLADAPVFISREHIDAMQDAVDAIGRVVALPAFRQRVLDWAPEISSAEGAPHGVFFGYDFHLTNDGPRLIEVNTNAGGALLLLHVAGAQQACCREVGGFVVGPKELGKIEGAFVEMFRKEFETVHPGRALRFVAIVDENPQSQYLGPEFELFRALFASHGIDAVIADPGDFTLRNDELVVDGRIVDLVYNRLTDFYLLSDSCATLREALEQCAAVFTPNPGVHALYANKRNLTLLSDPRALGEMGASREDIDILMDTVPESIELRASNAAELWDRRKALFFKPIWGYGSRGTYKGAKLTKKTWTHITQGGYIAQELVPPSERLIVEDGAHRAMKVDVRCYVYRGEIQLLGARMYRGQTTNFRTDGGGLAAVFTTPAR